jgi:zinc/manganese transport system substrate-binding protein
MATASLGTLLRRLGLAASLLVAPAWAQDAPLRVVTTFSILADMTRETGGNVVAVTSLVRPNADAHVYEPTPADVRRLAEADIVIVNGLRFEGWIDRLIRASGFRGPVITASAGVSPRLLNGEPDPHAWQSLANAHRYVDNIRTALVAARPKHAREIDLRAADYLKRIDALDRSIRNRLAPIPPEQRRVVTTHDAFGYFGAAYSIEFLAAEGWNTDAEPSAGDIVRLVRQIKSEKARALFVENVTDPRLLQRIAREAGVQVGGTLYSDALSAPGTAADTYLKLMERNATTLIDALR